MNFFSDFIFFNFGYVSNISDILSFLFLLYMLGLVGLVINFRNFLVAMMCIELMYLSIIMSFLVHANVIQDPKGQIYALLFLIIAASESAVGLGLLIVLFRFGEAINYYQYTQLRG